MEKLDKENNKDNKKSDENNKSKEKEKTTLSEEELELSKNIEDMVNGLLDHDIEIKRNAFNLLKKEITTSTGSMTSIPKPLKFCRLHFEKVREAYNNEKTNNPNSEAQKLLGDFLCILVLVTDTQDTSLQYILENGLTNFSEWGQELVRSLSGEITTEYLKRLDESKPSDDLVKLVSTAVNSLIHTHNENEAIDLLIELDLVEDIKNYCNELNYKKFCSYILAISNYAAESSEQKKLLEIVFELYTKYNELANALRVAIKLKEKMYITSTLLACKNRSTKIQMAFILARSNYYVETSELEPEISEIMKNLKSSEMFRNLARALDITSPKHPEEIFKSHLEDKKEGAGAQLESYKINMSTSLVSGFINAGFGKEKLLSEKDDKGIDWLSKNKEEGLLCALASLGLVNLWDIECGPNEIEKYMDVNEMNPYKRGGYNLGLGIISSGVVDENNTALALLSEQTKDKNLTVKITSIFGLALAYAGTRNPELNQIFTEVLEDFSFGYDVSGFASLGFGLVYIGSGDEDIIGSLISILLERNEGGKTKLIDSPYNLLYVLGIGFILFGNQKDADLMIEATQIEDFPEDLRLYIKVLLTICAYAGSGNVIKIQELQQLVAKKKGEINPKTKQLAIIGLSIIALGEEMGMEMLPRSFNHFLQFGDVSVKKAVSLAYAVLSISNPKLNIIDTLIKFTFDLDKDVCINSIFSLGLVTAGTNNSRLGTELRKMAAAYADESQILPYVRLAQGMLNLGKGSLTLNPLYSNNLLMSNTALAGVMIALLSFTESGSLLDGKYHFLLYSLALAIKPRAVITLDENLNQKQISLSVGQAVDTIGIIGNPRTISGFQTNQTPLLLNIGERCELTNDDWLTETLILEDVVIVKEKEKPQAHDRV